MAHHSLTGHDQRSRRLRTTVLIVGAATSSGLMFAVAIFGMAVLSWFLNVLAVPLAICGINGIQISERPLVMMGLHFFFIGLVAVLCFLIVDGLNNLMKRID